MLYGVTHGINITYYPDGADSAHDLSLRVICPATPLAPVLYKFHVEPHDPFWISRCIPLGAPALHHVHSHCQYHPPANYRRSRYVGQLHGSGKSSGVLRSGRGTIETTDL